MRSALFAALLFVVGAVVLTLGTADADVPRRFNYQAVFTAPGGEPITGNVSLFIQIFDTEAGGNPLYSENPILDIVDGRLDVTLPVTETVFPEFAWTDLVAAEELWLEITIDEIDGNRVEYIFPRQSILTSGYALRTGSVDGAVGGTIRGDVTVDGDLRLPDGIELTTGNGTLTIKAGSSSITLAPDGTLTISSSSVRVQSAGDIDLSAAGDVNIDGTNVSVTAAAQASIEGSSGVEVSTSSILRATGSLVQIN